MFARALADSANLQVILRSLCWFIYHLINIYYIHIHVRIYYYVHVLYSMYVVEVLEVDHDFLIYTKI